MFADAVLELEGYRVRKVYSTGVKGIAGGWWPCDSQQTISRRLLVPSQLV